MTRPLATSTRVPFSRRVAVVVLAACFVLATAAVPAQAGGGPRCRLRGDVAIATGDRAAGNGHTTDFVSNLGTGVWRHVTASGDRFDGRISILECHSNTGEIANIEGTGSFRGSDVVLTLIAHIEDRARLGQPDYYSIGIFAGATLVYTAAGPALAGDLSVTITP